MASNDPQFEEKAAAIIGRYLNAPENSAVFCVDGKRAIQALDRLDRRLPLSPRRAWQRNAPLHTTYSSWLNQVESWFSKPQGDVVDRGIFTSVNDLKRKILRYIRLYQKTARPFKWKYSDVKRRIHRASDVSRTAY